MFLSNGELVNDTVAGALAETTPLYVGGNYYNTIGVQLAGQFAAYEALYRQQLWVYVVCNKIGDLAARVPIRTTLTTPKGKVDASDSEYASLLAKPNPKMDEYALWNWTATTKEVFGEAIWVKLRDSRGKVIALQPMHPVNTTVKVDDDGNLWYLFTAGSRSLSELPAFPEADIVHFKSYNPANTRRGMSMLEPLRLTLANEDAARRATFSWWQRGARPSVALVHPNTLSKQAAERLRESWENRHAGADRMGGTAVLEEGMKPEVIQLSAEEMQYIESRKLNREEVCAAADMPPPAVHILDHATFSNITEQMRSVYRDTMTPRFRGYESTLDTQLRPEFDPSGALRAEFALDDVLRGDWETRVSTIVSAVSNAVMMPGEGREMLGLPDAGPVSRKLYANQALVPLDSMPKQPVMGVPPVGQRSVTRVRNLAGRLSRVKDAKATHFESALSDVFAAVFGDQRKAHKFVPEDWDEPLANELQPVAHRVVTAAGGDVAKNLGGTFDVNADGLRSKTLFTAQRINRATANRLDAAAEADDPIEARSAVWDEAETSRAEQLGRATATALWSYGAYSGATQAGGRTKTWVAGENPRPEHAALDGETVGIDEPFSNGGMWPGDSDLDVDETAGCNCSVEFN